MDALTIYLKKILENQKDHNDGFYQKLIVHTLIELIMFQRNFESIDILMREIDVESVSISSKVLIIQLTYAERDMYLYRKDFMTRCYFDSETLRKELSQIWPI